MVVLRLGLANFLRQKHAIKPAAYGNLLMRIFAPTFSKCLLAQFVAIAAAVPASVKLPCDHTSLLVHCLLAPNKSGTRQTASARTTAPCILASCLPAIETALNHRYSAPRVFISPITLLACTIPDQGLYFPIVSLTLFP